MKLLEGKTALITGASRGIGKAVALAFAKQGANIAFTDLRYDENAQATEKEIEACGVKAKMYASNAADFAQTAATVEEIAKEFGRIDILVNNAGITKDTLLMRMTEEQWDAVINVNLKSVFNFTKAVSAIMLKQKSGSIISMSSVVGVRKCRTGELFCFQSRYYRFYQECGQRIGIQKYPGQCRCSGIYHYRYDGTVARRCA